jgi:two-component system chemotaxis response regulator CheY
MIKRILIVDDSSMMRKLITRTLVANGYQIVGEAKSGVEALNLYKQLNPDLVTMDITMGDMDGLTAAGNILQHDAKARILFLSNREEAKIRQQVIEIGGLGLLNKHETNEILALIQGVTG